MNENACADCNLTAASNSVTLDRKTDKGTVKEIFDNLRSDRFRQNEDDNFLESDEFWNCCAMVIAVKNARVCKMVCFVGLL